LPPSFVTADSACTARFAADSATPLPLLLCHAALIVFMMLRDKHAAMPAIMLMPPRHARRSARCFR